MVKMFSDQRRDFPKLAKYIELELPQASEDGAIWEAFLRFSELKDGDAREALTWKREPTIQVLKLHPGVNGSFSPDAPKQIVLAQEIALRFEQDAQLPEAKRFVQATILHELVHWGDERDGRRRTEVEIGAEFERAAYGENLSRWWREEEPAAGGSGYLFPITGHLSGPGTCWGKHVRGQVDGEHKGIDVFAPIGTSVFAVASGQVLTGNLYRKGERFFSQPDNYGQMVDIRHDDGHVSRYAHLHEILVEPSQRVTAGEQIALSGASGTTYGVWVAGGRRGPEPGTTPPHLHFEIHKPNSAPFEFESTLDPAGFFDWLPDGTAAAFAQVQAKRPGRAGVSAGAMSSTGGGCRPDGPPNPGGSKRGLQNNCPGNLRHSENNRWEGMCPMQHDTAFVQFSEMRWGIRAMARVLRQYKRQGVKTLSAMSEKWAPAGDGGNNPRQHAEITLRSFGGTLSSIDQAVDFDDEGTLFATIRGIMVAECGPASQSEVSDATIREAIRLEKSVAPADF